MSRVSCSRSVGFWETALLDCGRVTGKQEVMTGVAYFGSLS
jgi:hypothetical protein